MPRCRCRSWSSRRPAGSRLQWRWTEKLPVLTDFSLKLKTREHQVWVHLPPFRSQFWIEMTMTPSWRNASTKSPSQRVRPSAARLSKLWPTIRTKIRRFVTKSSAATLAMFSPYLCTRFVYFSDSVVNRIFDFKGLIFQKCLTKNINLQFSEEKYWFLKIMWSTKFISGCWLDIDSSATGFQQGAALQAKRQCNWLRGTICNC